MGSDCDGVDCESLATTCPRSCDYDIHQAEPQLVSLRMRAVGVWVKIWIDIDGREHRQRGGKENSPSMKRTHRVFPRPDYQVQSYCVGSGAPVRRTPRPMLQ